MEDGIAAAKRNRIRLIRKENKGVYKQIMYIGPTIRGAAKHGDVFSGGLPRRLEKLARAMPMIQNLIVPVSGIVEAMKESDEEGSARDRKSTRLNSSHIH